MQKQDNNWLIAKTNNTHSFRKLIKADLESSLSNETLSLSTTQLEEVMYTRITTYRINTEKFDEALSLAEELKPEIMAIPGIKYWFNNGNEDGSCAVIAIYESEEAAEAAKGAASVLFARFAEYMESELQPQGYQMLLHGANP